MSYRTTDAKQQFDSWSARYDWDLLQSLIFKPSHRMLLETLDLADRLILDVGCGTGLFACRLLKRFPLARVVGLDLSGRMLRQGQTRCRAFNQDVFLVQGDSQRLPFADNAFDAVVCTHSFHHYPRQEEALAEMHRVLRPGGRLMIIDGDRDRPWGRLIFDVIVVLLEGRVRHLTSQAFHDLFQQAGFERIQQRRRGGVAPFLMTVGQAVKPAAARTLRPAA